MSTTYDANDLESAVFFGFDIPKHWRFVGIRGITVCIIGGMPGCL